MLCLPPCSVYLTYYDSKLERGIGELAVHIGIFLPNQPLIAVVMLVAGAIAAFGTGKAIGKKQPVLSRYKLPFPLGEAVGTVILGGIGAAGIKCNLLIAVGAGHGLLALYSYNAMSVMGFPVMARIIEHFTAFNTAAIIIVMLLITHRAAFTAGAAVPVVIFVA